MGIRARLDELQSRADWTLDQWKAVAIEALQFIADLQDGIGVRLAVDPNPYTSLSNILTGKGGDLPGTLIIDPSYSTFPATSCLFVGGPFQGKSFSLTEKQRTKQTIILKDNHLYRWDGRCFVYQGKAIEEDVSN